GSDVAAGNRRLGFAHRAPLVATARDLDGRANLFLLRAVDRAHRVSLRAGGRLFSVCPGGGGDCLAWGPGRDKFTKSRSVADNHRRCRPYGPEEESGAI